MSNKERNVLRILRYFIQEKLDPSSNKSSSLTINIKKESSGIDEQAAWLAHWQKQRQPWRIEPEISAERQTKLKLCLSVEPDIEKEYYPFKGMKLSRADVEWLLAKNGIVDWSDTQQRQRKGLNLCGADLSRVNLSGLPLACLEGGVRWDTTSVILPEQFNTLAVRLDDANLTEAHLEGAYLRNVYLNKACLNGVHLEQANLWDAHLENVELIGAHLEEAQLTGAYLKGADMRMAHLEGAVLREAHLEKANLLEAHLEGTELFEAYMQEANLWHGHLEEANLRGASLEGADLWGAHLAGVDFRRAHLEGVNFREANLGGTEAPRDIVRKIRKESKGFSITIPPANLQRAFFDNATSFRDTKLGSEKLGFVSLADVRWGSVNLSVIDWSLVKILGDEQEVKRQRKLYKKGGEKGVLLNAYHTAVRANRQLAVVLQSQGLNEDAARFAYRAQVLQRSILWLEWKPGQWLFSMLLALLTGYGYRMKRILIAYGIVIGLCAAGYFVLGQYYAPHLSLIQALLESITAFHGRVFLELFNSSTPQIWITAFEAIAGLVIEGVFIAMLTQRFFNK